MPSLTLMLLLQGSPAPVNDVRLPSLVFAVTQKSPVRLGLSPRRFGIYRRSPRWVDGMRQTGPG